MAHEMTWTRIMGVAAGFLAVLAYGHVLSVRVAVMIFLLFASCLVFGLHLAEFATREIIVPEGPRSIRERRLCLDFRASIRGEPLTIVQKRSEIAQYFTNLTSKRGKFSYQGREVPLFPVEAPPPDGRLAPPILQ